MSQLFLLESITSDFSCFSDLSLEKDISGIKHVCPVELQKGSVRIMSLCAQIGPTSATFTDNIDSFVAIVIPSHFRTRNFPDKADTVKQNSVLCYERTVSEQSFILYCIILIALLILYKIYILYIFVISSIPI